VCVCNVFRNISVNVPVSTRNNGSLFVHIVLLPAGALTLHGAEWKVFVSSTLTKLAVPQAATFQLVGDSGTKVF